MTNDRSYVEQRLAEINSQANASEPAFAYWKSLQTASRAIGSAERDARTRRDD
jgi:hypothetical protein